MDYAKFLEDLITMVAKENASDLHLSVGRHPTLRVSGQLVPLSKIPILTAENTQGLAEAMMDAETFAEFLKNHERDFSYSFKDKMRFRVNSYFQKGYVGVAMRLIPVRIKTLAELNIPNVLLDFAKKEQGFFLAVGPYASLICHPGFGAYAGSLELVSQYR